MTFLGSVLGCGVVLAFGLWILSGEREAPKLPGNDWRMFVARRES